MSVLASTVLNFPEESNETRWKYTCCCSFLFTLLSGTPHLGFASSCWSFATEFKVYFEKKTGINIREINDRVKRKMALIQKTIGRKSTRF